MPTRKINTGELHRSFELDRAAIDEESRTIELAFSSENPVERWWGKEILDHERKSVRMGRLRNKGAVLLDHNTSKQIGVVESVSIDDDRKGRATVRIGKGSLSSEVFDDVVDGIRTHVSVGYRIHKMQLEETGDDGETYRAIDWEPFEISIVSVPADVSVGVGRAADADFQTVIEENEMPKQVKDERAAPEVQPAPTVDINAERANWQREELERIQDIEALGEAHSMPKLAREFVMNGKCVNEFRTALLDELKRTPVPSADIGLTEKEARQFSFVRAVNALANPTDRRAQEAAAFEFEAGAAAAELLGKESRGVMVPNEVLKRDLTVGTATAGGHTVSTDLLAESFIDLLRNKSAVIDRATQLTGLVGNIAIPRQTGGATAYWVAESGAPTEGQQAFDQVAMSPNTVGAFTDISRKLLLQSSIDVEAFVRGDLARVLALALDLAAVNGSGASNQPTGILNTSGIGSVVGGTNGLAPTWDHIVDLETEVANDNADLGDLAYITNSKVRGKLKKTFVDASSNAERVWDTRAGDTPLNGYGAIVSNQVPSDLDKGTSTGVCSAIIFGNLADLVVGMWGGLDLMVDPYTGGTSGTVRVTALQDADVAVRHAESFAAMVDALTA